MRRLVGVLAVGVLATGASAQDFPVNFEAVELARSRDCVALMARVAELDIQLAPLAERSQRLLAIAQAIALEERDVIDSLRVSDPVEAEVRAWFVADGEMAQRYLALPTPASLERRAAARDSIESRVEQALESIQAEADAIVATTGTLGAEAGRCTGAVFLRPAVLETCQTEASPVCDAARDSISPRRDFRFVESAEVLWGLQEFRAWSVPGPIQVSPTGETGGARTVGLTRAANIVVTLAFGPRLRLREDLTVSEAARMAALSDSLGFGAAHDRIVYAPSLAIQATLPVPIGDELMYILHFGTPEDADILWAGEAGTGLPLEGVVDLGPAHLTQLQAGDPLALTALRPTGTGGNEPVYTIELTSLNQDMATDALIGYMAGQLATDLTELLPPGSP
ncbi:MAG: hypothetical protein EXR91_03970 [Gemmatimonadetes bacterium]|nr:hypothetical protein [Gemmatimonadota bacterium]